jgi:hypothetical protein
MKPPAAPMALVVVAVAALRARKEKALSVALGALAGSAVVAFSACALWLAAKGALTDAIDLCIGANGHYAPRERVEAHRGPGILLSAHKDFDPVSLAMHAAIAVGIARGGLAKREGRRHVYAVAGALVVAGVVGVLLQYKFYVYHWVIVVAGEALAACALATDLDDALAERVRARAVPAIACVVGVVALFVLSGPRFLRWWRDTENVLAYATGGADRTAFTSYYRNPGQRFYYQDVDEISQWLRRHAQPGDRLLVRRYLPGIYLQSGLRYGGRFFWDSPLTAPTRMYRRDAFLAQDRADLERIAPRWVIAFVPRPEMGEWWFPVEEIQSPAWFEARGYRAVHAQAGMVVMERVAAP